MKREAIADRLVNYGDAIAAFSFVNSLAFLLALTETEVRCSLADVSPLVYVGIVASGAILTAVVVGCRRVENRIRASEGSLAPDIQSLLRAFFVARIIVIWTSVAGSIPLVSLALGDSSCVAGAVLNGPS